MGSVGGRENMIKIHYLKIQNILKIVIVLNGQLLFNDDIKNIRVIDESLFDT